LLPLEKYYQGIIGDDINYQALKFPRSTDTDAYGSIYLVDEVRFATFEQSLWIMARQGNRRSPDALASPQPLIGVNVISYLDGYYDRRARMQ